MSNSRSRVGQLGQRDRVGAEAVAPACSPRSSVRLATVIDFGLLRGEMRRGELDHLAGADEQHALLGERREDALGQLAPRRPPSRSTALPISVVRAHVLGDRERALEQLVQHRGRARRRFGARAPPASSGRGSAARPAPSNRGRWRRGTRAAPRSPAAARRYGAAVRPGSAAFPPRRTPAARAERARARPRRSTARCGCMSRRWPPPRSRPPAGCASFSRRRPIVVQTSSGTKATRSRTASGAVV